jgi:hypothetical protein
VLSEPHSLTCLDTVDFRQSGVTATLNDPRSKVLSNGWKGSQVAVEQPRMDFIP